MTPAPVVICAGRLYADLIFRGLDDFPTLGREVFADALSIHPGGGAAITAAHLAANGCQPLLLAVLPAAPFGGVICSKISAFGIGTDLCTPAPPDADPQLTVAISTGHDRAFLTRRSGPAIPMPTPATLRDTGATHLHIGELATLVEHPDLPDLAHEAGMTVSLDCSWDAAHFSSDVAALIASADVFFPNLQEFNALRDAGLDLPLAPITVVKRGDQGAEMFGPDGHWHVPATLANVIDTTGAGDAFNGGFLSAWLARENPMDCLHAGARSGARSVSATGGFGGLSH